VVAYVTSLLGDGVSQFHSELWRFRNSCDVVFTAAAMIHGRSYSTILTCYSENWTRYGPVHNRHNMDMLQRYWEGIKFYCIVTYRY
jgi:hypothetical protein